MSVCNATTPAQYFHLLRRQMKTASTKSPKGLVICTPKTMLRARETFSSLAELGPGTAWKEVLDDPLMEKHPASKDSVERLVICSGKVYYGLAKKRHSLGLDSRVALVRIEELTPFPYRSLHQVMRSYPSIKTVIWAQEEPENAGGLSFVAHRIREVVDNVRNADSFLGATADGHAPPGEGGDGSDDKDTHPVIKVGFVSRPACASSSTGISEQFKTQQSDLERQVFDLHGAPRPL